ncbi:MAG: hypothetical protein JWO03_3828 [Bacteroidetes bacterium]|nr:hypothetical protein [Bacteroidota bacterium]
MPLSITYLSVYYILFNKILSNRHFTSTFIHYKFYIVLTGAKFFQLLNTFSVYELKRFRKYLCSPLHNEDETYIHLFDLVSPYIKADQSTLTRDMIGRKLYPQKKLSNQDYARLFTNFSRRIEGFMALEKYYSQPVREYTDVLESFNDRHLGKYFSDMHEYVKKLHDKQPMRSGEYYLTTFRIEVLHHDYLEGKQERSTNKNLIETLAALDTYYLITKLRFCAAMLHYQAFLSLEGEVALIHEILAHCADMKYDNVPLLKAYYYIVMSLIEPDDEKYFEALRQIIFANTEAFPSETQRDLFAFAINYCINRINYGNVNYLRQILELYQQALDKEIILTNGELSPWDFKNIVTIGLRNKDYKWTESFIEKYRTKIPKSERENAYTFNQARYYFATRKYDKVLQLLQSVEYSDIFYLLDSKTTLMKTYYELDEYQSLQSLKESFRILLRRKKLISEQNQINYSNFARYTMKLYRADVRDKRAMEALKKEIESTGNVADKGWILEKLAQMTDVG